MGLIRAVTQVTVARAQNPFPGQSVSYSSDALVRHNFLFLQETHLNKLIAGSMGLVGFLSRPPSWR
jgi:hypothetical protein